MSTTSFVRSAVSINCWLSEVPSVDAVRPAHCPICHLASRPIGARLRVWGHGLVRRTIRGFVSDETPIPASGRTSVQLRRFRCQIPSCGAVILVGPAEWLPGRRFLATGVALALFLWAQLGERQGQVYATVIGLESDRLDLPERWRSLTRWGRAAVSGTLFATPRLPAVAALRRQSLIPVLAAVIGAAPASGRGELERVRLLAGLRHAM